jgi:thiol-disulfide isomerase/thioredoxin
MRAIVLSTLCFSLAFGFTAIAEEPTTALGRKLARIQKKFEVDEKDLQKKLTAATDPEDRKQIEFLLKELHAFAAMDAVELAEESKKDDAAADAAVFAIKMLSKYSLTNEEFQKASVIILDHHINNPKIGPALGQMVNVGSMGLAFLQNVGEKTTNKEVQAIAFYHTALALDARATSQEGSSSEESLAKMRAEAVELMEKAVQLAPDAKIGDKTLAKAAEIDMVGLKVGVGNPAPEVEGTDLDGKKVKLSSYKGKVVLLDFWATWCGPCISMIPHEREMVAKLKDKPFVLLSVSLDKNKSDLTEFLATEKMPWAHWWDGSGAVAKVFKVRPIPTLYLIDAKGVVRKKWVGSQKSDVLEKAIEELLVEAGKK